MRLGEYTSYQLFTENFSFMRPFMKKEGRVILFILNLKYRTVAASPHLTVQMFTLVLHVFQVSIQSVYLYSGFFTLKFKWVRLLRPRDSRASVRNRKFRKYAQILTQ